MKLTSLFLHCIKIEYYAEIHCNYSCFYAVILYFVSFENVMSYIFGDYTFFLLFNRGIT